MPALRIRLWLSESIVGSPVRLEIQTGEPRGHSHPSTAFLISSSCAAHTCPSGAGNLDPKRNGHHPSPFTGTIAMTSLPSGPLPTFRIHIAAKILHGWPGLAVSLVLASPMLPATIQLCVHAENFFPRLCPVPKFVLSTTMLSTTMLTRLQILRLYHLWGLSSSLPILQKEQQQQGVQK